MNPKLEVAQAMQADVPLMALLAGGVYVNAQLTPGMEPPHPFDAVGRMRPSALVRNETAAADGPRGMFGRSFVLVFFYDHAGYGTIDDAADRARDVLHGRYLGGRAYEVRHVDDVLHEYDDALLAFMHRSRYQVMRYRG